MYRAIIAFCDLQDNGRSYEAGEQFPRRGLKVTAERLEELAGSNNRMGFPLIEEIAAEKPLKGAESADDKSIKPESKSGNKPRRSRNKGE